MSRGHVVLRHQGLRLLTGNSGMKNSANFVVNLRSPCAAGLWQLLHTSIVISSCCTYLRGL